MGLHRKNTYIELRQTADDIDITPKKEGDCIYVPEDKFKLAIELIEEQQQVIANMSKKIKNLRQNLGGINKTLRWNETILDTVNKQLHDSRECYSKMSMKHTEAQMKLEKLQSFLREILDLKTAGEEIRRKIKTFNKEN